MKTANHVRLAAIFAFLAIPAIAFAQEAGAKPDGAKKPTRIVHELKLAGDLPGPAVDVARPHAA